MAAKEIAFVYCCGNIRNSWPTKLFPAGFVTPDAGSVRYSLGGGGGGG